MNTIWKKVGLSKEEFTTMMLSSDFLRSKLADVISKELESLEICDDYNTTHWDLLQAETNGKRKAYQLILKLIKED